MCMYVHSPCVDGNMQPSGRDVDLRKSFKDAGFSTDPEENVFNMLGEQALGNIAWV